MSNTYYVLGGDARQTWAARRLEAAGCHVLSCGVPDWPEQLLPKHFAAEDRVVLPFPSFQGALLRGKSALPIDELPARLAIGTRVFGGLLGDKRAIFEAHGAAVCDLYGSEPMTTANAIPTAEGAIALAMELSPMTLHGARCLVIGFGRVGRVLAQKLHALSAIVTVSARKAADRAMSEALGMRGDETGVYRYGLTQYNFVFNTVPAPVLSEAQLSALSPDCILIELASKPGGMSEEACRRLGLTYHFAPGLPGRCAPAAAGTLYADCILQLEEQN